jgi:hypothetical protein
LAAAHESPALEARTSDRLDRVLSDRRNGRAVLRMNGFHGAQVGNDRHARLRRPGVVLRLAHRPIPILAMAAFRSRLCRIDFLRRNVGCGSTKLTHAQQRRRMWTVLRPNPAQHRLTWTACHSPLPLVVGTPRRPALLGCCRRPAVCCMVRGAQKKARARGRGQALHV